MKKWKGWPIIGFGFCMFMWGAFTEGWIHDHNAKMGLIVMVSVFTGLSFIGSIQEEK